MYQGYSYPGHQQAPQPAQFGHGAPVQAVAWNGEFSTKICPQQPFYSGPPPSQVAVVPTASCSFDLSAFAAMYNSHLATLTFNSKPIITNLTVIAHENVLQMANVIARCIDEHITQVPPPLRLPSLYLLDSISKNVGPPYTSLWAQRIAYLFLESYRVVDQPTKVRMEELLNTWRQGAPDGTPLFGGDAQWEIERNLYGSQGVPPSVAKPPPRGPAAMGLSSPYPAHPIGSRSPMPQLEQQPHDERWRAIDQIDLLLSSYALSPTRIAALRQLKTVVQTATLAPQEMEQIQSQLTTLANQARERSSTPTLGTPALATPPPASLSQIPPGLSEVLANLSKVSSLTGVAAASEIQKHDAATTATAASADSSAGSNVLIKSLMAVGLLPAASNAAPTVSINSTDAVLEQDEIYSSAVLSLESQFSSLNLHKELSPTALELLVPQSSSRYPLPLRCRQCANRYPAGPSGQKSLDTHLDWHFRQGRRAKDSAARGISRTWLDRAHDWIRGGYDDPAAGGSRGSGSGVADGVGGSSSGGKNGLSAQQEAELASYTASWVVAPTDSQLANAPCPICKEKFSSEWSEDEEEWIWRNATRRADGGQETYHHGSCYYSAKVLSANVISRPTTTPPTDGFAGGRRSVSASASVANSKKVMTPANPLERLREENAQAPSENGNDGGASKKRKESPVAIDGAVCGVDGAVSNGGDSKRPTV